LTAADFTPNWSSDDIRGYVGAMFIQIEKTQDPGTLRFLPGRDVLGAGVLDFGDREAAKRSPLAARLFEIGVVAGVSLGPDFVAVSKTGDADWQALKPAVLGIIMEHFLADRPVVSAAAEDPPMDHNAMEHNIVDHDAEDAEVVADIQALLDDRIRPGLANEGADVVLKGYRGGTVDLNLKGAALAGPLFSLKVRIENTLRHYVPAVAAVRFAEPGAAATAQDLDLDDPEVAAVQALLEREINPSIAAHGGYISLIEVKEHKAYLRLEGGCQGCGMADVTLKQGVERLILETVPSIVEVLDDTDHAGGTNPYYQPDKGGVSPY
jgi:Fe-S cluster biogenesis protein NfuA